MRILVVVNEQAGQSDAGLGLFLLSLASRGADVSLRFLTAETGLEALLGDAQTFDRVVIAGGDGTVSSACYLLRGSGVPVMVYPAGTGNLLAQNLRMPVDIPPLVETTLSGPVISADLGELEHGLNGSKRQTGFVVLAGAGYDAAMMQAAGPLKPTIGPAAYVLAGVTQVAPQHAEFELVLDGEHIHTDGIAVLLVNFGRLFFDLPVSLTADPSDGLFDVVVIRGRTVVELAPALWSGVLERLGAPPQHLPGLDVFTAREVEVSAYPPLKMQYDGELLDALTPFRAKILPHATRLVVPEDSPFAEK